MSDRTVKVRICVAVTPDGDWNAIGWRDATDEERRHNTGDPFDNPASLRYSWVEANVPLPPPVVTVEGENCATLTVRAAWNEYVAAQDDPRHTSRFPEITEAADKRVTAAYDALVVVMCGLP